MRRRKLTPEEHAEGRYVDSLVRQYQEGNEQSGVELLRRFGGHPDEPMSNYIGKFYNLIRYTRVNFADKDTRGFIALFTADPEMRNKLKPFFQYGDVKGKAIATVERLRSQCSVIPDDEFKQELRFLFLQQVSRFEKEAEEKYFTAYISKSYRFALYHYLNNTIMKSKEPYNHLRGKMIYMDNTIQYNEQALVNLDERAFTTSPIMEFDDELGNSWVRGITCGDEFRTLTPLQRLIIKLSFYEEKSDRQISEKTRLHINTINRQKLKSIQIIKEESERLLNGGNE